MLPPDLRYFKRAEFFRPDLVDADAVRYLDEVRHQFGFPLYITSDARLPGHVPSGGSVSSLHYAGRAFDLRWITKAWRLYHFVECAMRVASERCVRIELELVNSEKDQHIHIGLQKPGVENEMLVAAD